MVNIKKIFKKGVKKAKGGIKKVTKTIKKVGATEKKIPPKPDEPGFIGPVKPTTPITSPATPPKPGEPGFIGPIKPDTPITGGAATAPKIQREIEKRVQEQERIKRVGFLREQRKKNITAGKPEFARFIDEQGNIKEFTTSDKFALKKQAALDIQKEAEKRDVDISTPSREKGFILKLATEATQQIKDLAKERGIDINTQKEIEEFTKEIEKENIKIQEQNQVEILRRFDKTQSQASFVPQRKTIGGEDIVPGSTPRQAPRVDATLLDVIASPIPFAFGEESISKDIGKGVEESLKFVGVKGVKVPVKSITFEADLGKKEFEKTFRFGKDKDERLRLGTPKQFGVVAEFGTGLGILAVTPTSILAPAFIAEGTKPFLDPTATTTEKILGGVDIGLAAFIGVRGIQKFTKTPIKTSEIPLRPLSQPEFLEFEFANVLKQEKEFALSKFIIRGEVTPPRFLVTQTQKDILLTDIAKKLKTILAKG